jgi:hypothetical protein
MHEFLTSALVGGELSASRLGRFTPRKRASATHWIKGWVGPRTSLDDVEKKETLPNRDSNSDSLAIQAVASRYTDCAIRALCVGNLTEEKSCVSIFESPTGV